MIHPSRILGKFLTRETRIDWEAVYQSELPRVYNYFRYRVGDDQAAEDLTAETFEKAWKKRDQYRQDLAAFSTWLFAIAHNTAADHFRKNKAEAALDEDVRASRREEVEELVEAMDDFERLSRLLTRLPERERELIALKYGAGLTNRAIAKNTSLSESNVGTILNRLTQRLREAWEDER
jgi:RNA polymerase sigma-70 factor (ECF subfamily)